MSDPAAHGGGLRRACVSAPAGSRAAVPGRVLAVSLAFGCALATLAGCGDDSGPTAPAPFNPTRFTVFTSDRNRAPGSYRNYITGLDVSGTFGFTFGTGTAIVDRNPSITGDGVLFVYQSSPGNAGSEDVFMFNRVSGALTDDPNLNTAANETEPYVSLDGRRLAFVRDTVGGRRVRLYNTQTRRFVPLAGLDAGPGTNDTAPALDEQGQRMVFVSDRGGGSDVFVYDVAAQTLTGPGDLASPLDDFEPSISGNGRYVCFASNRLGSVGSYDLFLFDLNSMQLVPMLGNSGSSDRDPGISYDGRYVQFVSNRPGGLGGSDLWLLDRVTPSLQQVGGQNSAAEDLDPVLVWR